MSTSATEVSEIEQMVGEIAISMAKSISSGIAKPKTHRKKSGYHVFVTETLQTKKTHLEANNLSFTKDSVLEVFDWVSDEWKKLPSETKTRYKELAESPERRRRATPKRLLDADGAPRVL